MKKLSILSLLLCLCLFFVTGCEFGAKTTTAKPTETTTKKTTTEKTTTTPASELINDNGIFTIARSYTFNYSHTEKIAGEDVTTTISQRLSFDTAGNVTLTNLSTNATKEYTYSIDDTNLMTCISKDDTTNIDYYYYFVDIIVSADLFLMPGTLDGESVSQRGTTTIGQVSYIIIKQGDVPAVLSNDTSNENKYYSLRKNGTLGTSGTRVKADQLAKFDSTTIGRYATTLTVGSGSSAKVNPVIVNVIAAD